MIEKYENLAGGNEKPDKKIDMLTEIMNDISKKEPTYADVWNTLSKIDVTGKTELKNGFTYLKWSYAISELNKHYPQHHVEFDDSKHRFFEDGSQEIYCRVEIGNLYKEMWYPVTDYKNSPIIKPSCFDINTAKMRAMVKCIAMFGLGIQIFHDGTTMPEGEPAITNISNKTLLDIRDSDKQEQAICQAFKKGELKDKEVNEMEFGTALQPEIKEEEHPYIPDNLRTSLFKDYAYGLTYKAKNDWRMSPASRMKRLQADIKQEDIPLPDRALASVKYGTYNERCGIAKWMLVNQEACLHYCDHQKNWKVSDWMNTKADRTIALSCTPDGMTMDKKGLVEIKCSAQGNANYDEFPRQYLPQVAGQLMVLKMADPKLPLEYVDLVNWTPTHTKIWRYTRDTDYEKNLIQNLEDYSEALLGNKELPKKPIAYEGNPMQNVKLIYDEANSG